MWVQTADARTALLAAYFARCPPAGGNTRSKPHQITSYHQQDEAKETKRKSLGRCKAEGRIATRVGMDGQTKLTVEGKTTRGESGRQSGRLVRKEFGHQVGHFRTRANDRKFTSPETRGDGRENIALKMNHRIPEREVEPWACSTPELSPSQSSDSEISIHGWPTKRMIDDKADEMFDMFIDVGKCGEFWHAT